MEVEIRHTEPGDYEALHRIMSGPEVVAGTLQLPFQSKENWREKLENLPDGLYSLVACFEGEVVGTISLATFPRSPRVRHIGDIGMAVRDDMRGRGVGSELIQAMLSLADDWLGLVRIELEVYTDNAAAIELYKKFGFEVEGTLRCFAFKEGKYVNAFAMSRIRNL